MLKFEYHHLDNTLFIQSPGSPPQPITKTFTTNWGSPGFILEPANHWITFTIYPDKIRAFYKQVTIPKESLWSLEQVNYYQKDLPKEELPSNGHVNETSLFNNDIKMNQWQVVSFTFEPTDEVHKVDGKWIKKTY